MKDSWVDFVLQRPHYKASPEHPASGHGTQQRLNTGHTRFITEFPGPLCPTATGLECTSHFIKAGQARYWPARRCRKLSGNFISPVLPPPTWAYGSPGEPGTQTDCWYNCKPPESEYPRMKLVICLGLVISFRTCYYEKQISCKWPLATAWKKKNPAMTLPTSVKIWVYLKSP